MKDLRERLDQLDTLRRMLDDVNLTGDLLLFALGMMDTLQRGGPGAGSRKWWGVTLKRLGWDGDKGKRVLRDDVPRYEPSRHGWTCQAQMIRREGKCGASGGDSFIMRDPETGEWTRYAACSRHTEGAEKMARAKRIEWEANGSPQPANNKGGVLAGYFEGVEQLYDWVTPEYKKRGDKTPAPKRPNLTIIRGGKE